MPAVFQGSYTSAIAPTVWASATVYTTGTSYVMPTTYTGQYFLATVGGTSSGTQPAWSTAASLPVPGTTFIDGSVTWTCMGSIVPQLPAQAKVGVITVDTPGDTDPALVAVITRGLQSLANGIAYLLTFAGLTNSTNSWVDLQTFNGGAKANELTTDLILPNAAGDTIQVGNGGTNGASLSVLGGLSVSGNPLTGNGLFSLPILALTGATTLSANCPPFVEFISGSGPVTLPSSPATGQVIIIKQLVNSTLQVLPPSGKTLDGNNSSTGITISSQYGVLRTYFAGGSTWYSW